MGKIQPLDVPFFWLYKTFIYLIKDTAILQSGVNIWHHNSCLLLQTVTIFQFTVPFLSKIIQYPFYQSGDLDEKSGTSITPHNFYFKQIVIYRAIVILAHCEQSICVHFTLNYTMTADCITSNSKFLFNTCQNK